MITAAARDRGRPADDGQIPAIACRWPHPRFSRPRWYRPSSPTTWPAPARSSPRCACTPNRRSSRRSSSRSPSRWPSPAPPGWSSWFLVRRVACPVEALAHAAEALAAGTYTVDVKAEPFSRELERLSTSFSSMAQRLGDTETGRTRLLADLAHELRTPLATWRLDIDGLEGAGRSATEQT